MTYTHGTGQIDTVPPQPVMSPSLSLDEEARLYTTNAEREKYESLATLYGIVVALDYLERAYVRDSVTAAECVPPLIHGFHNTKSENAKRYPPACTRLLSQYKTMLKLVGDDVPSIEQFMSRYRVSNNRQTAHDIKYFSFQSIFFFVDGSSCSSPSSQGWSSGHR
jgi:hypothetical protein